MRIRPLPIAGLVCLVATCAAVERTRPKPAVDSRRTSPTRVSVKKIEQALKLPVEADFLELPLHDALNYLSEFARIPIEVDQKAFAEDGISTDTTVTLKLHGPALHSVLELLLEPLILDYVIGNGVLRVTTSEVADASFQSRQYDVADLIDFSSEERRDSDYRLLSRAIQLSSRSQWEDGDGEGGTITLDLESQTVTVKQSQRVQRAIVGLLTSLRKLKQFNSNSAR